MVTVTFDLGTLVVSGADHELAPIREHLRLDQRIGGYRAAANDYGPILRCLHRLKAEYCDQARDFQPIQLVAASAPKPRPIQDQAVAAWQAAEGRGVVVLPTGTGKSYVAMLAMLAIQRPTLIVAPTLDLVAQWVSRLQETFDQPIGMLGGGSKDLRQITVSTYDSAALRMEFIGNRFGLVIFDECHHLPGPVYRTAASMCIAPWRLGLTATPERNDGDDSVLDRLVGPICLRRHIDELEGSLLAPYETHCIEIPLDDDEQQSYERERAIYTSFLRRNGISFRNRQDWSRFIILCARLPDGREAFSAYLTQKRIARSSRGKQRQIWALLRRHAGERTLIFTADNDMAYELGRQLCLPVLTQHTKLAERKQFLEAFRQGQYPVLVSSRVLNEGIDVPQASVGIVVSGTGSVREHVQRLGRILRPARGKQAQLYELISQSTAESFVSDRRRQHRAYQRPGPLSQV